MPFDGSPVPRSAWWFDWNEEAIARLKELAASGMTAADIAIELGCSSRSAVLGKLDRLRRSEFKPTPPPKPKAEPMTLPKPVSEPHVPEFRCVTIVDLNEFNDCRWIVFSDSWPALYCGLPRDPDASYCPFHRAMAYVKPPSPRRVAYNYR
jgi:hypothetical protein